MIGVLSGWQTGSDCGARSRLLGSVPAYVRLNALALIIFLRISRAGYIAKVIQFGPQVQATFHRFNRNAFDRDKVKSVSLNHRFMIASHSPDGVVQTVLLLCPSERKAAQSEICIEGVTLSGPV
jgi:hypothetical protein